MTDRSERYLARLDAHMATLKDDGARRRFLQAQSNVWSLKYAAFVASEGASEWTAPGAEPPQAADFVLTITGLAARLAQHDRVELKVAP